MDDAAAGVAPAPRAPAADPDGDRALLPASSAHGARPGRRVRPGVLARLRRGGRLLPALRSRPASCTCVADDVFVFHRGGGSFGRSHQDRPAQVRARPDRAGPLPVLPGLGAPGRGATRTRRWPRRCWPPAARSSACTSPSTACASARCRPAPRSWWSRRSARWPSGTTSPRSCCTPPPSCPGTSPRRWRGCRRSRSSAAPTSPCTRTGSRPTWSTGRTRSGPRASWTGCAASRTGWWSTSWT